MTLSLQGRYLTPKRTHDLGKGNTSVLATEFVAYAWVQYLPQVWISREIDTYNSTGAHLGRKLNSSNGVGRAFAAVNAQDQTRLPIPQTDKNQIAVDIIAVVIAACVSDTPTSKIEWSRLPHGWYCGRWGQPAWARKNMGQLSPTSGFRPASQENEIANLRTKPSCVIRFAIVGVVVTFAFKIPHRLLEKHFDTQKSYCTFKIKREPSFIFVDDPSIVMLAGWSTLNTGLCHIQQQINCQKSDRFTLPFQLQKQPEPPLLPLQVTSLPYASYYKHKIQHLVPTFSKCTPNCIAKMRGQLYWGWSYNCLKQRWYVQDAVWVQSSGQQEDVLWSDSCERTEYGRH